MKKKMILAAVTLSMALSAAACSQKETAAPKEPTIATVSETTASEAAKSAATAATEAAESAETTAAEESAATEPAKGGETKDTKAASADEPELTMVKFIQIKQDMTVEEVNEILGFEGELTKETGSAKTYEWINGSKKVSISFIDNKADTISQVGLDNERGWISG